MERKTKPTMHPHTPCRKHAFGKAVSTTASQSGAVSTDVGYTGQREEVELGLYFYNARWYDPVLGRFAQADTIVPNPVDAKAFDRYAYVYNNPVRYNDPSGHCVESNGQETGQGGVGYACPGSTWKKTDPIISSGNSGGGISTSAEPEPTLGGGEVTLPDLEIRAPDALPENATNGVDVTYWLYNEMVQNANTRYTKLMRRYNYIFGFDYFTMKAEAMWLFKNAVDYNAPWDFKVGFNRNSIQEVTIANTLVRMDAIANIHYGFVGSAAGFTPGELLIGAGIAQYNNPETRSEGRWYSYLDDPFDTNMIRLGVALQQSYGNNMSYKEYLITMDTAMNGGFDLNTLTYSLGVR
jgi:RHS repeat-associated protein